MKGLEELSVGDIFDTAATDVIVEGLKYNKDHLQWDSIRKFPSWCLATWMENPTIKPVLDATNSSSGILSTSFGKNNVSTQSWATSIPFGPAWLLAIQGVLLNPCLASTQAIVQ